LRVAVVGAGPSGVYAVEALAAQRAVPVTVDVLDRLPTPFGLVRYGVAPDHHKIRAVRATLERLLELPGVSFLGNVEVGGTGAEGGTAAGVGAGPVALGTDELRACTDAVVYSYGAARDRRLGIPGEDLTGSVAATDVVAWYCGNPDPVAPDVPALLRAARSAVVVGVGNVAVDVARVLARAPADLARTDMPEPVLEALAASPVTDVWLLGRRGPAQATFTTKELRELGDLDGADVDVDPADLELDPLSAGTAVADRAVRRNLDVLAGWAARPPAPPTPGRRRIHLRFWSRPVELVGPDRVRAVVVERTALDTAGAAVGTGVLATLEAQLVVRSVGYRGVALAGLPFDPARGIVPNRDGRVLRDGVVSPGEYVTGWIKRGPTGIIGTNRRDAVETVTSLLTDAPDLLRDARSGAGRSGPGEQGPPALADLLAARGARVLSMADWRRIDAAEIALGASRGRERTTLHERAALLAAAEPPDAPPGR